MSGLVPCDVGKCTGDAVQFLVRKHKLYIINSQVGYVDDKSDIVALCEDHKVDMVGFPSWREISQEEYEMYALFEIMDK
jgi:hypothetical protein